MPIYNLSPSKETETFSAESQEPIGLDSRKDRLFSSMTARILFFLLLLGDLVWAAWTFLKIGLLLPFFFLTFGKAAKVKARLQQAWVSLKRAGVCGISLLIALFSPALGIMIACTYFLMYDKMGIHEVVPRSLQDQFQEFIKESKD